MNAVPKLLEKPEPVLVRGIPSAHIPLFWHFAEPYVKRALDHTAGELKPADIRERCESCDIQLWLIAKGERVVGAGTTELVRYPQRLHCRIITLAGSDFDSWVDAADREIEHWATDQGCAAIETLNRKGFVPKLEKLGFKVQHVRMIRTIRGEAS